MTQAPVRFAILGFGHHAVRRLLPAFGKCKAATLIGMWRRDQAAAGEDCREHGIAHSFPTREALCASPEVDVVLITSPDAMHRDDTMLALGHGKAVLCEKPAAMNAAEAQEMEAAAAAAGLIYGVAQNFRFNRSLAWMREQIAAGRIGRPQLASAQYSYPAAKAPRKWIADPTLACGGPVADVGVHCIDALRYILDAEVKSISTLARRDEASGRVEAVASLQMEMTGGVYANVTASARAPYRTLVEVNGSDGVLIAENGLTVDRPVEMMMRRGGELVERVTVEDGDAYTRMLDGFALAFRGEGNFPASGADAVRNMRAVDAAYASWESGRREVV
jgi:1,5-anhydro-D-fructose reductase (1,5-anhydro-D-mannitol-forming)